MLSNHQFELDVETNDNVQCEIADDWLTKDELAAKKADAACWEAEIQTKPMVKQEGEKSQQEGEIGGNKSSEGGERMVSFDPEHLASGVQESPPDVVSLSDSDSSSVTEAPLSTLQLRRSGRKRKPNQITNIASTCGKSCEGQVTSHFAAVDRARELQEENQWTQRCALVSWLTEQFDPEESFLDESRPDISLRAFKAAKKGSNPDLPNHQEAMEGEHQEEFKKAMQKEVEQLERHGIWQGVLRSSVPEGAEIVPLTWAFHIKRKPSGDFDKFKARLCIHGDLQSDAHETFAPVAKWSTIRTVLAFALRMRMKSKQIDFENAFVQAELSEKDSIFVTLSVGVNHPTH